MDLPDAALLSIGIYSKVLDTIQMREALLNSDIRRRNLRCLWHRFSEGRPDIKQQDFAPRIGTTPATLSQWLKGHRNIGPTVARRIEEMLKLESGWMDERRTEEWEVANMSYDGRARSHALTHVGMALAARIEALSDDRAIEQITAFLELLEERQARSEGASPHKRKPV